MIGCVRYGKHSEGGTRFETLAPALIPGEQLHWDAWKTTPSIVAVATSGPLENTCASRSHFNNIVVKLDLFHGSAPLSITLSLALSASSSPSLLCGGSGGPKEAPGCLPVLWYPSSQSHQTAHTGALQDQKTTTYRAAGQSGKSPEAFSPGHGPQQCPTLYAIHAEDVMHTESAHSPRLSP
ncbi:hypothetical protein G5714_013833 [Onychostoma macrolepis]|uniref:Uncharacterized protein n=1 Tax=Onychostoma macrolepis TaxID=369639 RepID=A0A7J6CGB1_9TELE|nr:hypothetical protein G5714_013833 [Onychostoma macrolepis]